jgi:hypothetical protein
MNISILELKNIFIKIPDIIIEKIYYYQYTYLDNKIQRDIINYKFYDKNIIMDYSIYSYVHYIPIKYIF